MWCLQLRQPPPQQVSFHGLLERRHVIDRMTKEVSLLPGLMDLCLPYIILSLLHPYEINVDEMHCTPLFAFRLLQDDLSPGAGRNGSEHKWTEPSASLKALWWDSLFLLFFRQKLTGITSFRFQGGHSNFLTLLFLSEFEPLPREVLECPLMEVFKRPI